MVHAVWFFGNGKLYQLHTENSEAQRYTFPGELFAVANVPGSIDFFISDNSSVWRFDAQHGKRELLVDAEALGALAKDGPTGLPQPRSLVVDASVPLAWLRIR